MIEGLKHIFFVLNTVTGKVEQMEFHFDRVVTRKEALRIVTQVEGNKVVKKEGSV